MGGCKRTKEVSHRSWDCPCCKNEYAYAKGIEGDCPRCNRSMEDSFKASGGNRWICLCKCHNFMDLKACLKCTRSKVDVDSLRAFYKIKTDEWNCVFCDKKAQLPPNDKNKCKCGKTHLESETKKKQKRDAKAAKKNKKAKGKAPA